MTEEENNPGETLVVDIEKGASPMSWSPADVAGFTNISVSME